MHRHQRRPSRDRTRTRRARRRARRADAPAEVPRARGRCVSAGQRGPHDRRPRARSTASSCTELGTKVDPLSTRSRVDGKPVSLADEPVYLAFNKPAGVVTTMSDPQGRHHRRRRSCPSRSIPGSFRSGASTTTPPGCCCSPPTARSRTGCCTPAVTSRRCTASLVDGRATEPELDRLREGVALDDGLTAPARVRALRSSGDDDLRARSPSERVASARCAGCSRQIGHPVLGAAPCHVSARSSVGGLSRASWRLSTARRGRRPARGGRA